MEIEENKDYMLIKNAENFNIKDTLYSGQMFRFQAKNKGFIVQSGSEVAEIEQLDAKNIKISSKNLKYFKNFFDFDTDYDIILKNLEKFDYLKDALNFSRGIRMLKQQPLETLICFIISANNQIPRIQKSVEFICHRFGSPLENGLFSFPTLMQLSKASVQDFLDAGTGFRAKYLKSTIDKLVSGFDLEKVRLLPTEKAKEELMTLSGVGPKVADCVLLFGLNHQDVFPVDTWIAKVYNDLFETETNRIKMRKKLVETFGNYSGIAQQYLFYYKRENDRRKKQ